MTKVRWGIIGCGGIAEKRTIGGLLMAENAECVAIMDLSEEALERVGEKFGIARRYSTVEEILAQDDIDVVYIATPVFCHKEQVMAAAKAGKHILLEKPMGLTTQEGEEIKAFCEECGVKLGVGFMMRFHGAHQEIKKIIDEGGIGEVISAYAKFNCLSPVSPVKWRQTKAFSGGAAMMDMGIHCIDLLQYLTGLKAEVACGFCGNQIFQYPDTEDAGTVAMKMNNGAMFNVEANFNIPDSVGGCKFEIYGTEGSIISEGTIGQLEVGTVRYININTADQGYKEVEYVSGNMYTKETRAFSDAVMGKGEIPVTADEAIFNQKIVESVYESQEKGIHVKL